MYITVEKSEISGDYIAFIRSESLGVPVFTSRHHRRARDAKREAKEKLRSLNK